MEAIDLLTDFVGRPKIDPAELDKERGVVIQEIQRYKDQPAAVAEELIDRAALRRPPARAAPCWAPRITCGPSPATRSSPSASAAGPARAAARSSSATSTTSRPTARSTSCSAASPTCPRPRPTCRRRAFEPRVLVEQRDTNQSHLRMMLPPAGRRRRPARRAPRSPSTRRCWAARWARACSTRSASSAACATRSTRSTTPTPTCRSCSWAPAWSRASASRPTRACARSSAELAADGPTRRGGRARARLRRRAPGPGLREHQRRRALRGQPADRLRRGHRPRRRHRRCSTRSPSRRSREAARTVDPEELAVACVGPHESASSVLSDPLARRRVSGSE